MYLLDQSFHHDQFTSAEMDDLWSQGWRHFGEYFFRYSLAIHDGRLSRVTPLRIDLNKFSPSRSQKRVLSRNRDIKTIIRDTIIDEFEEELFYRHRERFRSNIPDSLYDFLSTNPAIAPCVNREISVYSGDRLIAASFLDVGQTSTSAVYSMFHPSESKRSLGIFTILEAIRYSRELKCRYYYPGYAYQESSLYDYKKNFSGLEYLDWGMGWKQYSKSVDSESVNLNPSEFVDA